MGWLFLILAGFLEIGFTSSLKLTENFTKLTPTISFLIFSLLSFFFLNLSLGTIPLGIAYAVWTGIGAAGTLLVSSFYFAEAISIWKLLFLLLLIISLIGIKVAP